MNALFLGFSLILDELLSVPNLSLMMSTSYDGPKFLKCSIAILFVEKRKKW